MSTLFVGLSVTCIVAKHILVQYLNLGRDSPITMFLMKSLESHIREKKTEIM